MSYKDDMNGFSAEMSKRRRLVFNMIKITVCVLAVALIAMTVTIVVSFAGGGSAAPSGGGSSGGSSGSSRKLALSSEVGTGGEVYVKTNATVSYFSYVVIPSGYTNDNVRLDNTGVDTSKPGTYTVTYTLVSASGKVVNTLTLKIVVGSHSRDELMNRIATEATRLGITKELSTVEKIRKIYEYVNSPSMSASSATFAFTDKPQSSRPNWNTANWESDWIEEAWAALDSKEADCFSYYSVSKAFFEYFGIENTGVKRAYNETFKGAHVLNLVNIGTKEAPKWYYYDSTRLGGTFADGGKNACLVTKAKLDTYTSSKGETGFFNFDTTGLPTTETTPLS